MSLLNRPSDGMLSVLVVLFNLLLKGAQSRDFIVNVCSPVSVVKDKSVEQTLNTWIKLGMFHEAPDGKLSIHQDVRKVDRDIRGRLLVFFPGQYEHNNYRLLDARDGWNYLAIPITHYSDEFTP